MTHVNSVRPWPIPASVTAPVLLPMLAGRGGGGGSAVQNAVQNTTPSPGPPAPAVASIVPTSGPLAGATAVPVMRTGFASASVFNFGATAAASVQDLNATTLVALTPAELAAPVDVTVENSDDQEGALTGGFTFTPPSETQVTVPGMDIIGQIRAASLAVATTNITAAELPPRFSAQIGLDTSGGSLEMPRAERGNERQCRSCAASRSPPSSE